MKHYFKKKYLPSYLTILIGFILSCLIFWGIKRLEKQFTQYKFKREKEKYLNILNFELAQNINILNAVEQLFLSSKNVDREEFQVFTGLFLKNNPKIKALSWAPLVKSNEREKYEIVAQKEGYKKFKFTEINEDRKMIKRKDSSQYYPVYFIEPIIGNEAALGFDLFSNKDRAQTILTSLKNNEIVGTSKIKLVQEKEDKYAFLLFNPIYKKIKNEEKFLGFVTGVFRIDDVIDSGLNLIKEKNLEFKIYDITDNLNTEIYTTKNYFNNLKNYKSTNLYSESSINFPNRDWRISFIPGDALLSDFYIKWEWLSLIFFNIITIIMLSIYLFKKIKYTDKIELLMNNSIESEKKLKLSAQILANTPEGVMVTDKYNKIISVNDSFLKTTKYLREDVIGHNPKILNSNHHKLSFYKKMWESIKNNGIWQGEIWNRRKNGEIYPEWLNIMTINNEDNKDEIDFYVGIFS
ncbi:MAG: CHASE domain-containing protein, partial [Psychrilyobacter sp.]|uniref:CHASE domain-containing protein n=1 Tax=Psychrilyobacter sp. TaxID=2586924 RepID=UPI003C7333AE